MSKWDRTRELRCKRPALVRMSYESIVNELDEISEACYDMHWYEENDKTTLLNAVGGDEDELWEFKMAFSDMEAKAYALSEAIRNNSYSGDGRSFSDRYDDCTVALIGNRFNVVGFDSDEEDYMSLTGYEEKLAQTEAGKRLMRLTKAELISNIGQCFGILIAFLDLSQTYDRLAATLAILRDEYTSLLECIRNVNSTYDAAERDKFDIYYSKSAQRFSLAVSEIPDIFWLA